MPSSWLCILYVGELAGHRLEASGFAHDLRRNPERREMDGAGQRSRMEPDRARALCHGRATGLITP
jgi:hypothetical protein